MLHSAKHMRQERRDAGALRQHELQRLRAQTVVEEVRDDGGVADGDDRAGDRT